MCGLAGFIGKRTIDRGTIDRTLDLMKNRGPDHRDTLTLSQSGLSIALLHGRLSILDLDPRSHQPFNAYGCSLIYNGEIYNYVELRKELEKQGFSFRTESDTEVLVAAYAAYGTDCVKHFEGMWSFALFDSKKQRLFLSRDRFAEKPLYYIETPEGFYFGSEVKFLSALSGRKLTVNKRELLRYMVNGYKSLYKAGETFFEEVRELPFAHNGIIGLDLQLKTEQYWQPRYAPHAMSLNEAVEGIRERLVESVKIRLRADVPLAFCLSGGVDSGTIVSIAAKKFGCKVACYSIVDPDERYNEYENIKATIDDIGCETTCIELQREKSVDKLRELIAYHDAPIATITYYIHSFLSEAISRDGFKVVFSGTASDELFTGYYDHFNLHLYELRNHPDFTKFLKNWETHISGFVRNPYLQNPRLYFDNPGERRHIYLNNDEFASYLKVDFNEDFAEEKMCDSPLRNRMLNEIFYEATRVILHEDDLNSMKYSLENRSPFLDTRLFDFCYSIPTEHLIHEGYGKYLLREAMAGILNDKVRLDRQKKGFNAAIESVFDLKHNQLRDLLLDNSPIYELVDRAEIEKVLDRESYPNSFSKFLFNFINSKIFLELQSQAL